MSVVDEIHDAIEALERVRGDASEWWAFEPDPTAIYQTNEFGTERHVLDTVKESDRDLIVTLHRTIDAQLAILRDLQERISGRVSPDWEPIAPSGRNALALARAINGVPA